MTVNEKLIDDAVTAFADRDVTAPGRGDLRIALEAFETSLTRCGCEPCTTERRARIALTEHDRTALARALHEVVYSPGSNYDRAVPGIQEHVLACAEKVAAALPWLAPHTPTDDEREVLRAEAEKVQRAAWAEIHGQDPARKYSVAEVKRLVYSFDNVLSSALRRSEVPGSGAEAWSTEDRREALAEGLRRWSVQSQHDRVEQRDHDLYGMGARQGFALGAEWWKSTHAAPEPQGEQSDAYELTVDMLEDLLVTVGVAPGEHGTEIRKTAGALVYKIGARLTPSAQGEPSDVPELPDDCDCEDREALVRPEGLVCGTCDKVIAPGGVR